MQYPVNAFVRFQSTNRKYSYLIPSKPLESRSWRHQYAGTNYLWLHGINRPQFGGNHVSHRNDRQRSLHTAPVHSMDDLSAGIIHKAWTVLPFEGGINLTKRRSILA